MKKAPTMSSRFWSLYIFGLTAKYSLTTALARVRERAVINCSPTVNPNVQTRDSEACSSSARRSNHGNVHESAQAGFAQARTCALVHGSHHGHDCLRGRGEHGGFQRH